MSTVPEPRLLQGFPESDGLRLRPRQRSSNNISSEATRERILATKVSRWMRAREMSSHMKETDNKKCAHVPCSCAASEKYCSQACEEAGISEIEIAC